MDEFVVISGQPFNMEILTEEEVNFAKLTKIILDIVPKYLRRVFISNWNDKYEKQHMPWKSDSTSGYNWFSNLPAAVQKSRKREKEIEKIKVGDEEAWDTTTLVFALLSTGQNLIPGSLSKEKRTAQLDISKEIEVIRDIRKSVFHCMPTISCSNEDFADIVRKVKAVAKNIFGQDAEDEIDDIVKSQIKTRLTVELQKQLDVEINRNRDFNELVSEIEGRFSLFMLRCSFISSSLFMHILSLPYSFIYQ